MHSQKLHDLLMSMSADEEGRNPMTDQIAKEFPRQGRAATTSPHRDEHPKINPLASLSADEEGMRPMSSQMSTEFGNFPKRLRGLMVAPKRKNPLASTSADEQGFNLMSTQMHKEFPNAM